MKKTLQIFAFVLLSYFGSIYAQFSLNVTVQDSVSGKPIARAEGELMELGVIKHSDETGRILFESISTGVYTLRISAEDYSADRSIIYITDKPVYVTVLLKPFESITDTIDVRAKFFKREETVSTSYINTFNEEIRKSPGSGEDIVRFFSSSPGVSIGWDQYNDIIARGGSPVENLIVIDGLEVINANHYGTPGSSAGVLSYINLKMVKDVDFYTGGFPPKYGTRLSSVMDIKFKDGNTNRHHGDVYIAMTGFGIFAEGPLSKRSSYILSARRSYLELVKDQIDMPLLPEFWDANLKLTHNFSSSDKISLVGLFATDDAYPYYKKRDFWEDTVHIKLLATGINYEKAGKNFSMKLTGGYNLNYYKVIYGDYNLDINDNEAYLKQEANIKLNSFTGLDVYASGKYVFSKYKIWHAGGFNSSNFYSPYLRFDEDINTYRLAAGANLNMDCMQKRLIMNFGLRFDKFGFIKEGFTVSPRFGLSFKASASTYVNLSYGIYYQAPELLWAVANENNRNLRSIKADTYVAGAEHFFSDDIRLNAEVYLKQYLFYPVSVYDPNFIFINSGVDLYPNFLDEARSAGKGFITGIDVTFQKKNPAAGMFWTLNYSFSKSKFLALTGDIQQAEFDYGNQLTAILGIKLKSEWSFSARIKYAGKRPYTPYDIENSINYDRAIYDKTKYNKARMPEYIRCDVRMDKNIKIWGLSINAYIEVQNIFNRENVFSYYWSYIDSSVHRNLHWSILPLVGFSCQF